MMRNAPFACALLAALGQATALAGYRPTTPRTQLAAGEVPVTKPGCYAEAGKTYVLMADVASEGTPIYLGKDVTLDLNGHTLTYAAGNYEHVPNYGFEEGLKGWDLARAPGAKVVSADVRPMIGKSICELPEGQELLSPYITLPVADRPYYALCAVATREMAVTINVDDAQGRPVDCKFRFGNNVRPACPEVARSPKLGGGVVFALLFGQPAGKYRIRVKAEKGDCLIDEVDIRPALDVGVGIVQEIRPWAYYKCVLDGDATAFFSLFGKEKALGIPIVNGAGTVTIRNGVIQSGTVGIRSWAIQSTAKDVLVRLENLKVVASGINTNAADIAKAEVRDCRFEIDTPFIIDRHNQTAVAVNLFASTEVAGNEFLGGQGCLNPGTGSVVRDNLFVNNQTVTNHYSIACGRSGNRIFNNRFEPIQGSGIYISGQNHEVHHNSFQIATAPPNCEYRYSDWSQNAIRMSDYDRDPGSPDGCYNNRVHHNTLHVTARAYPQFDRYIPAAYGFHYSCGGGTNHIYDNEITVDCPDPKSNVATAAIFISGVKSGADWFSNRITSNVPAIWLGGRYGPSRFHRFYNNTIAKAPNAPADFQPVKMGWWKYTANDTEFYSNRFENCAFGVALDGTGTPTYLVGWTLTVKLTDAAGQPLKGAEAVVTSDSDGREAAKLRTDDAGLAKAMLPEYRVNGRDKLPCAAYTVRAGGKEEKVTLDGDKELVLRP
ncbi:MAG TPA: hypothetical protein PLE19_01725 [Planctomycetota bacterium]|nr:hypothetical protein [Planctomycetota bacterium]HRR83030.1 hypothetical protein [Planctomycetota bacterium]HRT93824.1 hypothetical protein [Planctomycetota bacterium]